MPKLLEVLNGQFLTAPGDTPYMAFRKRLLFCGGLVAVLVYGLTVMWHTKRKDMAAVMGWPGLIAGIMLMAQLAVEKHVRSLFTEILLYMLMLTMVLIEYQLTVVGWVGLTHSFVLLTDVVLVLRLDQRVARNIIVATLLWLVVSASEFSFRYGLFDIPMSPDKYQRTKLFQCDNFPCKRPVVYMMLLLLGQTSTFLLDFWFTRGFANRLHREHDRMNEIIKAAQEVADALAQFDLDQAENSINKATMPPALSETFSNILSNLHQYRPYLPNALFDLKGTLPSETECTAPGLDADHVTIVFTDIQGSTATWEACPEGMKEGLRVHNKVMRECISEYNGYEVKTIGDAFMVAFESAADAVGFALSIQEQLVEVEWPTELLALEHCAKKDDGMWHGLRVRVGVHCGEVDVQLNPLTGRYDYFGNTVNKAARMEGACVGGAVAVTPDVIDELGPLEDTYVMPMGEIKLKGVSEMVEPFLLLPAKLRGRVSYIESQLRLKREERKLLTHRMALSMTSSSHSVDILRHAESASVAVAEMVISEEADPSMVTNSTNETLARLTLCTERSHGVVVSLQGTRVAIGWNTTRTCTTHVENSLAFVNMLHFSLEATDDKVYVGLSSGPVLYGSVGIRKLKFVTVVGQCVNTSTALCAMSYQQQAYCLYGAPFTIQICFEGIRFVPVTEVQSPDGTRYNVFEIVVDRMMTEQTIKRLTMSGPAERSNTVNTV